MFLKLLINIALIIQNGSLLWIVIYLEIFSHYSLILIMVATNSAPTIRVVCLYSHYLPDIPKAQLYSAFIPHKLI